ncbi:MAG: glycosyltransferase [Candidatus Eisenbacteria bacterium]
MRPLSVLYLIHTLGQGGAQRQLVTLVNALDRTRIRPEVAFYYDLDLLRPELERTGTPVHVLGLHGAKDPRVALRLALLIDRSDFDIVHCFLNTPGVLARLAVLSRGGPKIILSERSVDLGSLPWTLPLERMLSYRADAVVVNAPVVRRHVEGVLPRWRGRVHIVPNGVSWKEPTPEQLRRAGDLRDRYCIRDDGVLLSSVGRLSREKNPLLLLDAFAMLSAESRRKLSVIWVGASRDESLKKVVEERVRLFGVSDHFHLLPETNDIGSVYVASDAVVLTSCWEGSPNSVLEALASGTPVIATDVGDVHEMVVTGRTGWLVPPEDVPAMAAAISGAVATPRAALVRMGREGAKLVLSERSTEKLVERTEAVYRHVLSDT